MNEVGWFVAPASAGMLSESKLPAEAGTTNTGHHTLLPYYPKIQPGKDTIMDSKLWNVLIYLAADNNLKEEGVFILTEIMKAETPESVNVFAEFDSGLTINEFAFSEFRKKPGVNPIDNRTLEEIAKPITGDDEKASFKPAEERLQDFLSFNLDQDSKNNMVVLSGHGNGAVGSFLSSDRSPISLTIPSLGNAINSVTKRKSKKIDVLGLDSCLMSMAEVCYEVKGSVDYIVGAEGFARSTGWPYYEIIGMIGGTPHILPQELACGIVKEYVSYYAPYTMSGVSVDHSACNLSHIQELADKIKDLAEKLTSRLNNESKDDRKLENALILAHWRAQAYKFEQYVDLWDFCEELRNSTEDGVIRTACHDVQKVIEEKLIVNSCYSGSEFQHSHGVSLYFPWAKVDLDRDLPNYKLLKFDQETQWSKFLEVYGEKTQREMRTDDPNKVGKPKKQFMPVEHELGLAAMMNIRNNVIERTSNNVIERTSSGQFIFPKVKNLSDHFLKYDDDCKKECKKIPE